MKKIKLGEITEIKTGRLNANQANENGEYPFFTCATKPSKIHKYAYDCECVLVAGNGDLNVKYYKGKFNAYQRVYIIESINKEQYNVKFLYYFLQNYIETLRENSIGGVIKYIRLGDLTNAKLPNINIDEQLKIVDLLEKSEEVVLKRQQQIEALSALKQSVFLDMFGDPQLNSKEWPIGKISDLTEKTQYGTSKKAHETEGTYPVLRMNNLTYSGEIDLSDLKYVDLNEKEEEKYLVYPGEMLFNRTNSRELVGKTAVYQREKPIAYAGYLVKLIPNTKGNTTFISGYLNSHYGKRYLFNLAKNSIGMSNINATELRNIPIYIPPISLQNSYEEKINFIDEKVKLLKEGLRSLEMLYQSLLHKAFNGELFKEDIKV